MECSGTGLLGAGRMVLCSLSYVFLTRSTFLCLCLLSTFWVFKELLSVSNKKVGLCGHSGITHLSFRENSLLPVIQR